MFNIKYVIPTIAEVSFDFIILNLKDSSISSDRKSQHSIIGMTLEEKG